MQLSTAETLDVDIPGPLMLDRSMQIAQSPQPDVSAAAGSLMRDATLFAEFEIPSHADTMLAAFGTGERWNEPGGVFGVWLSPKGEIVLRHRTLTCSLTWQSPPGFGSPGDIVRLSYQFWDDPGQSTLQIENGVSGYRHEARFVDTDPVPLHGFWSDFPPDFRRVEHFPAPVLARGINGLSGNSTVPTPHGDCPVSALRPGDAILTETGQITLNKITLLVLSPAQQIEAICLRAPYFGLRQNITVLPDQRLRVSGPDVEAVTGHDSVLIRARDITICKAAFRETQQQEPLYRLSFSEHACVPISGCVLAFLGSAQITLDPIPPRALPPIPWASSYEAREIVTAQARRKGIDTHAGHLTRS